MKILWHSVAPWIPTGYGQQTAQVCKRLVAAGHDVAISAYSGIEGTISSWEGIPVFPRDHTGWNKYALRKYVQMHSEDGTGDDVLVIALQDVWTWLNTEPRAGGCVADFRGLRLAAWTPVDHYPVPINVVQALEAYGARPIAMSRFGEAELRDNNLDPAYVPHGIDTNAFSYSQEAREAFRRELGIGQDAFLIGMNANNGFPIAPSRKSFSEVFHAFKLFLAQVPDAVMYLHTDMLGLNHGLNLLGLMRTYQIDEKNIRFVNQDNYWLGRLTPRELGYMYSSLDVLVNTSHGEGFGIPIVEAQACGTPVIVTDWTSMTELAGPAQWLVDGEPFYNPGSASQWKKPAVSEILARLHDAYARRGDMALRDECVAFASAYDADRVFSEFWVPALEKVSKRRTVAALPKVDPKVRRAALKAAKAQAAA